MFLFHYFYCILLTAPFFLCAENQHPTWKDRARVNALHQTDLLLYWGFCKTRNIPPAPSLLKATPLDLQWPQLQEFANEYGYFSLTHPLIGKVSSRSSDITLITTLLNTAHTARGDPQALTIAINEILCKGLAYRDLPLGSSLTLPIVTDQGVTYEQFTVDCIFDIWHGMPAFGLVPTHEAIPSLLLFRGTDFSFITKRGLASVMSDLDPRGPGLYAFSHAKKSLNAWLKRVHDQGKSARVMGFSLGGALASYTFIYSNPLLSCQPSIALCPPGVSSKVSKKFYSLPAERQSQLLTYVNSGDIISQVGHLVGPVYTLSREGHLKPLTAHTSILSANPPLYCLPSKEISR